MIGGPGKVNIVVLFLVISISTQEIQAQSGLFPKLQQMDDQTPKSSVSSQPAPFSDPQVDKSSDSVSLSVDSILDSLGIESKSTDARHDFVYQSTIHGEQWEFSLSLVEDQHQASVHLIVWLDPIPQIKIEQSHFLKLLSENHVNPSGYKFAYVSANNRLVLEKRISSLQLTPEVMETELKKISEEVSTRYHIWSTTYWKSIKMPQEEKTAELPAVTKESISDGFEMPIRR